MPADAPAHLIEEKVNSHRVAPHLCVHVKASCVRVVCVVGCVLRTCKGGWGWRGICKWVGALRACVRVCVRARARAHSCMCACVHVGACG